MVLKVLPAVQCRNCSEYILDDTVMGRMEEILHRVDAAGELGVIRYAE